MDLERLKEEVAYLKFWQGVAVVTDISLMGWLVSACDAATGLRIALASLGIVLISWGSIVLHRRIEGRIQEIGQLSPWKLL